MGIRVYLKLESAGRLVKLEREKHIKKASRERVKFEWSFPG